MILRKIFAFAALICAIVGFSSARAEGPLRELATSNDGKGWEAVGRINIGHTGYCTGALIAPDLVLTAAHCLYNPHNGVRIPISELEFLAGWRNGRAEAYRRVRRVASHPDYTFEGPDLIKRVAVDVAILELDQPIRNSNIKPFTTAQHPERGDEVHIVSYATGRDNAPSLEEVCEVLERQRGVLVLTCDVDFGASGSPIFMVSDGEVRIVSVVAAKAEIAARQVALAAELGETLALVQGLLEGSDGVFRRSSPVIRAVPIDTESDDDGAKFLRP